MIDMPLARRSPYVRQRTKGFALIHSYTSWLRNYFEVGKRLLQTPLLTEPFMPLLQAKYGAILMGTTQL